MLIDLLVDIAIACILCLGGIYGYKRGIISMMMNPIKSVARIYAAVTLCCPLGELIIAPVLTKILFAKYDGPLARTVAVIVSVALAFLLIMSLSGFVISAVIEGLSGIFSGRIIASVNSTIGMLLSFAVTAVGITIIVTVMDIYGFDGGPLFRLIRSKSTFT